MENDTSALNSSVNTNSSFPVIAVVNSPAFWVALIVLTFSTITFIIGLSSWIVIKKFRHYRNYVFLNVILNNILNTVMALLLKYAQLRTPAAQYTVGISYIYLKFTVNFWLFVMCHIFYVDLVKVLGGDVNRKYLKSSLFGWGLPLVITLWNVFVMPYIESSGRFTTPIVFAAFFMPLVVNLLIYVKVLYILLKTDVHGSRDRWQRIQVSTTIFFISGALMLLMPLRFLVKFPYFLTIILFHIQPVAMNLYFFIVRLNRSVWTTYFANRIKNACV